MSAYDKLLLDKALASTNELVDGGVAAPLLLPIANAVQALFPLVETGAYSALEKSLVALYAQITEVRGQAMLSISLFLLADGELRKRMADAPAAGT